MVIATPFKNPIRIFQSVQLDCIKTFSRMVNIFGPQIMYQICTQPNKVYSNKSLIKRMAGYKMIYDPPHP